MIQIKNRYTGDVIYECAAQSMREAVEQAVKARANLTSANLARAYLSRADLAGANLSGAYLSGADLAGANLSRADLSGADLAGADLAGANLSGANLSGANLSGANLAGAYLSGADLAGANLSGAYLSGADLAGADLSRAYLSGADLSGADLAGATWHDGIIITRTPLQVYGLQWPVTILDQHMQIGCQLHTLAEWAAFDDAAIVAMDGRDALRFWRQNKAALLALAHANGRGIAE